MSTVLIEIPEPIKSEILLYTQELLDSEDVVEWELFPHITLKWGLETSDVEVVAKTLGQFNPIQIMFGMTNMFVADDNRPTDVVKIDIYSTTLQFMRGRLNTLPAKESYKVFSPHLTLAYVQPQSAMKYVQSNKFTGTNCEIQKIQFLDEENFYTIDGDLNITHERNNN